jgi:hypothetical protein
LVTLVSIEHILAKAYVKAAKTDEIIAGDFRFRYV